MIPFIDIAPRRIFGFVPLEPFGLLVVLATLTGVWLVFRRAKEIGLDRGIIADALFWTLIVAFTTAHLTQVLLYTPERMSKDPWVLIRFWDGLSSFGGFLGAAIGGGVFLWKKQVSIREYADAMIFGIVPGWIFGRLACTTVHDHPGLPSAFFLAVAYPDGPRHDLGFYEFIYTLALTVLLYGLRNRRPFVGFHTAVVLLAYAPVRFCLDFLRVADETYGGLTPAQYFAVAMFFGGLALWHKGRREARAAAPPPLSHSEHGMRYGIGVCVIGISALILELSFGAAP